jgi:hypothetical protein
MLIVRIHPQRGDTIIVRDSAEIFKRYAQVLVGHEIYFELFHLGNLRPISVNNIVNNVNRPLCGQVKNIFLLHPPARGLARKALEIVIESFAPEFQEPLPDSAPPWADGVVSKIPGVAESHDRLSETEERISELEAQRQSEEKELQKLGEWGQLLWLTGIPLQRLVQKAFKFLGFDIEPRPETGHAEDFVARHGEFVFLIEATGTSGTITIEKGRQLMQWLADSEIADCHGTLVANAFSTEPPANRPPTTNHHIFSVDLVKYAERYGVSLLNTQELFRLVCTKLAGKPIDLDSVSIELCGKGVIRFSVP